MLPRPFALVLVAGVAALPWAVRPPSTVAARELEAAAAVLHDVGGRVRCRALPPYGWTRASYRYLYALGFRSVSCSAARFERPAGWRGGGPVEQLSVSRDPFGRIYSVHRTLRFFDRASWDAALWAIADGQRRSAHQETACPRRGYPSRAGPDGTRRPRIPPPFLDRVWLQRGYRAHVRATGPLDVGATSAPTTRYMITISLIDSTLDAEGLRRRGVCG